jgi:hypothetical protein
MISPSSKQIQAAIGRLPQQASAAIKQVLANARVQNLPLLIEACDAELKLRGTLVLTADTAAQAAEIAARVAGKPLREVIALAFTEVPPRAEEQVILRWLADHPGTSFEELKKVYGKGDLSLVIGHLVYYRFGYFRPLLVGRTQSDLLLERDTAGKSVRYTLRPEAAAALAEIGWLVPAA